MSFYFTTGKGGYYVWRLEEKKAIPVRFVNYDGSFLTMDKQALEDIDKIKLHHYRVLPPENAQNESWFNFSYVDAIGDFPEYDEQDNYLAPLPGYALLRTLKRGVSEGSIHDVLCHIDFTSIPDPIQALKFREFDGRRARAFGASNKGQDIYPILRVMGERLICTGHGDDLFLSVSINGSQPKRIIDIDGYIKERNLFMEMEYLNG